MNKEELLKKNASLIGVSASEKELALDILLEKILEQIQNDGDAVRINQLGVFQIKRDSEKIEIIFAPVHSNVDTSSKTFFLRLPISKNYDKEDEDVFSLSVGKPIVPIKFSSDTTGETESSFVYIKKRIEERVEEILKDAQFMSDFNLWDEYLQDIDDKESNESGDDDSKLLEKLNEPEPEPEEDENDDFMKAKLDSGLNLYKEPEDDLSDIDDDLFEDLETFKNLSEKEDNSFEDVFADETNLESKVNETEEESSLPDTADKESGDDELNLEKPELEESELEEEVLKPFNEDTSETDKKDNPRDEKFDLDRTIFNEGDDEVDWNWGDELNEIDESDPIFSKEELPSKDEKSNKEIEKRKETQVDSDPFGTLERTLEQDPEFRVLTGEHQFEEERPVDEEVRVTNLDRPRPVPPKPTRMTRLTQETITAESESEAPTKSTSSYRGLRDKRDISKYLVIGSIVVIIVAIIYFAFPMSGGSDKEILQPAKTNESTIKNEQPIVTDKNPTTSNQTSSSTTTTQGVQSASSQDSQVEEIRVSNLIFRRGNDYNVQVSSWRSSLKASDEVKRLKAKGFDAFSVRAYLPTKGGTWHRVRIGGFKSVEEARKFLNSGQF